MKLRCGVETPARIVHLRRWNVVLLRYKTRTTLSFRTRALKSAVSLRRLFTSIPLNLEFIFKVFRTLGLRDWLQLSRNSYHVCGVLCKYRRAGSLLCISITAFKQSANVIRGRNERNLTSARWQCGALYQGCLTVTALEITALLRRTFLH